MKKTYKVLRQHDGDKQYFVGDERIADDADVKHLVEMKILAEFVPTATKKRTKAK